jgi:type IV secretory pathway TraG/TraD family ATPase VirD4
MYLYPLYRLLIESAYRTLSSMPNQRRRPLTVLLNEFDSLGWMDVIERAPAHARSSRIWFVCVVQNLEQLFGTYGYDTQLWGHLRTKLFLGPDIPDRTAKRLVEMLGDETIPVVSQTQSDRHSRTRHSIGRKLLDQAEVMGLGREAVLVWVGLQHPLLLAKPPYWKGGQ